MSIKATWLKDAKVDLDALTDVSVNTHRSADAGSDAGELDEQVRVRDCKRQCGWCSSCMQQHYFSCPTACACVLRAECCVL